jgi:hypothetical protein
LNACPYFQAKIATTIIEGASATTRDLPYREAENEHNETCRRHGAVPSPDRPPERGYDRAGDEEVGRGAPPRVAHPGENVDGKGKRRVKVRETLGGAHARKRVRTALQKAGFSAG